MKKIVIAENNEDFAYVIKWHFEQKDFKVHTSNTGEEAIELYKKEAPDIILLDINLDGEIDGKEVAREIRNIDKYTPIIFMSGESKSPKDVVEGFDIGCNFFLKKPLSIEEIEAHILALLNTNTSKSLYKFMHCSFDTNERVILFLGEKEYLSEKEAQVLQYLADYISQTVELDAITKKIWNDTFMEESLRNIISSLRKKIVGKGLQIVTIKNQGYRLEET